ncbi:hypothetical protein YC2023_073253 [Brassica napus]
MDRHLNIQMWWQEWGQSNRLQVHELGKKLTKKKKTIQEAVNPTADIPSIHASAAKMKTRVLESNGWIAPDSTRIDLDC